MSKKKIWVEEYLPSKIHMENEHDSYGSHMSSMLLEGLDKLGIKYVHRTAHDTYKNGILKEQIHRILVKQQRNWK